MDDNVMSLKNTCDGVRQDLKTLEEELRALMRHPDMRAEDTYPNQRGEMKAQTMLAVRHIEDARMRVGKILQYAGDGVSILDKQGVA